MKGTKNSYRKDLEKVARYVCRPERIEACKLVQRLWDLEKKINLEERIFSLKKKKVRDSSGEPFFFFFPFALIHLFTNPNLRIVPGQKISSV